MSEERSVSEEGSGAGKGELSRDQAKPEVFPGGGGIEWVSAEETFGHSDPDRPDAAGVGPLLRGRLGFPIEFYPQLESTNRTLSQRALAGAPEGTTVIADQQTGGRGRLSRAWFSPPGVNLYLSVLLRPDVIISRAPLLNMVAAVAAREAFREHGIDVGIKWPNDLLTGGGLRKVAGILAEMRSEGERVSFVVLGVGFNLNMPQEAFPTELAETATSVCAVTGQPVSRPGFAACFLERLEAWYDRYLAGETSSMIAQWRASSVTLGQEVRWEVAGAMRSGIARDIDPDGSLVVQTADGVQRVTAGDVHLVGQL